MKFNSPIQREANASLHVITSILLAVAAYIFTPNTAQAYAQISTSIENVGEQVTGLPSLLQYIFYILGIALVAKGLLNGKKYSENPAQAQGGIAGTIGPLAIGGLLIALPSVSDMVINSVFTGTSTPSENMRAPGAAGNLEIGDAIARFTTQIFGAKAGLFDLIAYISYVVAILLFGSMLKGAYKISSGGQGAPQISGVVWRGIGAAALMVLPRATEVIRMSLFDNPDAKHNFAEAGATLSAAAGGGLDAALVRLVIDVKEPVMSLVFLVAFLCGIILIAQTLYAMSGINFEQQGRTTPAQMIIRLIFGGILMSSWSIYQAVSQSLLGSDTPMAAASVLAWSDEALNGAMKERVNNTMNAVFIWVQIFGVIAFFRGWFTLKGSLDGTAQAPKSAGITQVIAGAMCMNISSAVKMVQNTLGVTILTS